MSSEQKCPLWSHSGYCFENGNGLIKKKVHAATGVVHQICRSLSIDQSELILRRHLETANPDSLILSYVSYLNKKEAKKNYKNQSHKIFW